MKLGILLSALVLAGVAPIAADDVVAEGNAPADGKGVTDEYVLKPGVFAVSRMATLDDVDSLTVISADESQDQVARTRLSSGELRLLRGLRTPHGDGGGAAIENLQIWQRNFIESNCPEAPMGEPINVILFLWDAPSPNPLGTDIIVDDVNLGNVTDEQANIGGNARGLRFDAVAAGLHTFGIEDPDTGTSETIEFEVLDAQPMADPEGLQLEPGPTVEGVGCIPSIGYQNLCPVPDAYDVIVVDTAGAGVIAEGVSSTFNGVTFQPFPAADYTAEFFGFMSYNGNPNALYRCCPVISQPVTFDCDPDACATSPASVLVQQGGYAGAAENSLTLSWMVDESFVDGTNILINGTSLGEVDTTGFSDGNLVGIGLVAPPGEVTIGVEGLCLNGPSGTSEIIFEVLGESPHASPFDGSIVCSYDVPASQTVAQWANGACSSFFEFSFVPNPKTEPEGDFLGRVPGNEVEARVNDTSPGELTVDLQGFVWVNNNLHSSIRHRCTTERPPTGQFIRGVCNAGIHEVRPQLSNAVFLLRALFQDGDAPTCQEACDMNDDSLLNVADALFLLRHLFSGAAAPPGYVNNEPACNDIEEGMDCETANTSCPI